MILSFHQVKRKEKGTGVPLLTSSIWIRMEVNLPLLALQQLSFVAQA